MGEILFQIDRRDFLNGMPDAPFMTIRKSSLAGHSSVSAQSNDAALKEYSDKLIAHGVTRLSISTTCLANDADSLSIRDKIEHLTVSPDLMDPQPCKLDALGAFPNLVGLTWLADLENQPVADVAPRLRFLHVEKAKSKTLQGLDHLKGLNLMSGLDALAKCTPKGLKTLFICAYSNEKDGLLSPFVDLKTLSMVSRKKNLSFEVLATLPALENFSFDGPKDQNWTTLPKNLQIVSIEKTNDSESVASHLSDVDVVAIGFDPDSSEDEGVYRGDLLKIGDPFRTIEGPVFEADI